MFWKMEMEGRWELARPVFEHFAHFHFRSHLQTLINRKKPSNQTLSFPEVLPSDSQHRRSYNCSPLPLLTPLLTCVNRVSCAGRNSERTFPHECQVQPLKANIWRHQTIYRLIKRARSCLLIHVHSVCMCARQRRREHPRCQSGVRVCGIWRAAEWCSLWHHSCRQGLSRE